MSMVRAYIHNRPREWDRYICFLTAAYRSTVHPATGFTPNFLMFGREVNLPIDLLYPLPKRNTTQDHSEYVRDLRGEMEECYAAAREALRRAAERQERVHDTRIRENEYHPGDLVLRSQPKAKKLESRWAGPFIVTKSLGGSLYRIANQNRAFVSHHDMLKPFLANRVPRWALRVRKSLNV